MKKYIEKVALMLGLYEGYLRKEKRLVRKVLQKVDKNSLHDRTFNCWDQKFIELVPVLHLYDEALNVLENYGGLRETYFANLLKRLNIVLNLLERLKTLIITMIQRQQIQKPALLP